MPASKKASMPELASDEIKLAPTEAVRAAMDLHDSSVKTISLRGRDYFPFTNKAGCRTVREPSKCANGLRTARSEFTDMGILISDSNSSQLGHINS